MGARCYYGGVNGNADSATYAVPYGALYNWAAVHSGKLAPKGWHIADTTEWNTLIGTLNNNPNFTGGNDAKVGGMLKEKGTDHWATPNTDANNSSGFTALPSGFRSDAGSFNGLGNYGCFWSSTESISNSAYYRGLYYDNADFNSFPTGKLLGLSVVCVRD